MIRSMEYYSTVLNTIRTPYRVTNETGHPKGQETFRGTNAKRRTIYIKLAWKCIYLHWWDDSTIHDSLSTPYRHAVSRQGRDSYAMKRNLEQINTMISSNKLNQYYHVSFLVLSLLCVYVQSPSYLTMEQVSLL